MRVCIYIYLLPGLRKPGRPSLIEAGRLEPFLSKQGQSKSNMPEPGVVRETQPIKTRPGREKAKQENTRQDEPRKGKDETRPYLVVMVV